MPSKHSDATATEKLLGLYTLLLLDDRPRSLTELAKRFTCSKPTILRLMQKIAQFEGVDLCEELRATEGKSQKWYWLERTPKEHERRCMGLSDVQMRLLQVSRDIAAPFLPDTVRDALDESLRLAAVLNPPGEGRRSKGARRTQPLVQPAVLGGIDYGPFQNILQRLLAAIEDAIVCEITYAPQEGAPRIHEMAVTGMVSGRNALYIRGWRVSDKGTPQALHPLFLAVHRIQDILLTRRVHTLPPPPEEAGFGIMDGEPFRVQVRFDAEAAPYVRERVFGPDQTLTDDVHGGVTLAFTARSRPEVISWSLGFGGKAHVLEPAWLASELRDTAAVLLARYT